MPAPVFTARRDARLRARILSDRTLAYDGGDIALTDRPRHVRAGSGIAWQGEKMFVIEDDADCIAIIGGGEGGGGVAGYRLKSPTGGALGKGSGKAGGQLQIEAVLAARDWRGEFILAFGSGSAEGRRCVARVRIGGGDTELSVFETRRLYQALEDLPEFAGTTLNIEGVALLAKGMDGRDGIRLFQRGNGKTRGDGKRLSATCDIRLDALLAYLDRCKRDPAATLGFEPGNVRRYDLDSLEGVPLTFTDAAAVEGGKVVFIAAAERCEDAGINGPCYGTALGVIDSDGSARYTIIVERDGPPTRRKADGLAVTSEKSGYIVVEPKTEDDPSTLCAIELSGV